jgi:hypothetical protein
VVALEQLVALVLIHQAVMAAQAEQEFHHLLLDHLLRMQAAVVDTLKLTLHQQHQVAQVTALVLAD